MMKYYNEAYQYCKSDTHRSEVLARIFHETKSLAFTFVTMKGSNSKKATILTDDKVLQFLIQEKIEELHDTFSFLL